MALLSLYKVSLSFIGKDIIHEVGFQVNPAERIGLVGSNGSGKTSLLRLITSEIAPDSGEIRISKDTRIGYLPQDIQGALSGALLKSVLDSVPGRVPLENKQMRLEEALKTVSRIDEEVRLAERLAEIHQELIDLDRRFPVHEAEKILLGLGFDRKGFSMPVSCLSGGWKTRAALACLLYQRPDLLLLDEPTNHLDIPSIRWFEQYLEGFTGAIIIVSHDREFLNRQARRLLCFEQGGLRSYMGNYDFYLKVREEEKGQLQAEIRKQEQKVKEAQKFIERFRAKATKARQAQSKIKLLEKIELVQAPRREKTTRFSFPEVSRSGRNVVSIKGMSKSFGVEFLYRDVELTVLRGDRIAIIGPNGCGKTTLLRMVADEIKPDTGVISLGHGVHMGYFAQHHSEMLNPRQTVLQEVHQVVPHESIGFVRGVLGAFLFSGEDVDKMIVALSGGEKARVALAKLIVKPGNLMVMDEPTNHLDIASSEQLIKAMTEYNGTLLFVSHNQSFINRLATTIWDIREKEIIVYPGNLHEYYAHLDVMKEYPENRAKTERSQGEDSVRQAHAKRRHDRKAEKRQKAEKRRLIHDTLKPILFELEQVEKRIEVLECSQKELEKKLADPVLFSDKDKSIPLMNEYSRVRRELDELLMQWEQSQSRLESTEKYLLS